MSEEQKEDIVKSQCYDCAHFNEDEAHTCKAFPEGIPDKILFNEVDHKKPYKDDNGIQFEKKEP